MPAEEKQGGRHKSVYRIIQIEEEVLNELVLIAFH